MRLRIQRVWLIRYYSFDFCLLPEAFFLHSLLPYSFNFESITFHNLYRVVFWRWFFCWWAVFRWVITTVIYLHSKWNFESFFLTRKRRFWHSESFDFLHCRWRICRTISRAINFFPQTIFFLCFLEFFKVLKKLSTNQISTWKTNQWRWLW